MHRTIRRVAALVGLATAFAGLAFVPGGGGVAAAAGDLTIPGTTPARVGPPDAIAVLGDSISQGTGSDDGGATLNVQDGGIGSPRLRNSWATGDWSGLNSYLQRVRALPNGANAVGINLSANGANMRNDFLNQARSVPTNAELVLVEMGGNDLCRPSESAMTSTTDYRTQLRAGLEWLEANRPNTLVSVFSVPDIYNLWYLRGAAHNGEGFGVWPFNSTAAGPRATRGSADNSPFWARQFWDGLFGSVIPCETLLVDPTNPRNAGPTPQASHSSEARRLRVRARALAFNDILESECAAILRCRFDNDALFTFSSNRVNGSLTSNTSLWKFVDRDISTQDHFHPSFAGQRKLAAEAFAASYQFSDQTAPAVTAVGTPAPNAAGWNTQSVSVAVSASDAAGIRGIEHRIGRSGPWTQVFASSATVPVSGNGLTEVEVRAIDKNGNVSASRILPVRIDRVLPQVSVASPVQGAVYEHNAVVAPSAQCTDSGGSGVADCEVGAVDTSTIGTKTFTAVATDAAGNTKTETRSYTVIDVLPPEITIASPVNGSAVPRHDVVVADYGCVDQVGGSGVASCTGPVADGDAVDTSTIGAHDFTVDAADGAGNESSLNSTFQVLDVTAPVITLATPAEGARYARGSEVVAGFDCADEEGGSGIAPGYCAGTAITGTAVDTSTLGTHEFTVTATDRSGNTSTVTRTYEVYDGTAPTILVANATQHRLNESVEPAVTCADEEGGSGLASCDVEGLVDGALDTATVGPKSFTVTATDEAGNVTTATHAYDVVYDRGELREPVEDGATYKAGRTIPVKFALADAAGEPVSGATVAVSLVTIDGDTLASADGRWDADGGQYVANLRTTGAGAGDHRIVVALDDDTTEGVFITLR